MASLTIRNVHLAHNPDGISEFSGKVSRHALYDVRVENGVVCCLSASTGLTAHTQDPSSNLQNEIDCQGEGILIPS